MRKKNIYAGALLRIRREKLGMEESEGQLD